MGLKEKLAEQAAKRRTLEPANLPADWEGRDDYFVRKLTVEERDHYEDSRVQVKTVYLPNKKRQTESKPLLQNLRARLLVKCLADAQGARIFTDDDAASVGRMFDGETGDALFEQAMRFNGLMPAKSEEEEEEEDLDPNALATGSAPASGSPSPSASGT